MSDRAITYIKSKYVQVVGDGGNVHAHYELDLGLQLDEIARIVGVEIGFCFTNSVTDPLTCCAGVSLDEDDDSFNPENDDQFAMFRIVGDAMGVSTGAVFNGLSQHFDYTNMNILTSQHLALINEISLSQNALVMGATFTIFYEIVKPSNQQLVEIIARRR